MSFSLQPFVVAIAADLSAAAAGATHNLTASVVASTNAVNQWDWDFGGGLTATGANASISFATPGAYPITLTATDSEGRTSSTGMVLIALGAVATTPGGAPLPALIGDVDGDSFITLADAHRIAKHASGVEFLAAGALPAADFDLDGDVDEGDALLLAQAVMDGNTLPSALSVTGGTPGTFVNMLSTALLDPAVKATVKIGSFGTFDVFRPLIGYATFAIPLDLGGGIGAAFTPGPITIDLLIDDVVTESFAFELAAVTAGSEPGSRIRYMLDLLGQARGPLRNAVDQQLTLFTVGGDSKNTMLGLVQYSNTGLSTFENDVKALLDRMDANVLQAFDLAAKANGLEDTIADLEDLVGNTSGMIANLPGDDAIPLLCEIRDVAKGVEKVDRVIRTSCDLLSGASILAALFPDPGSNTQVAAALAGLSTACASVTVPAAMIQTIADLVGRADGTVEMDINPVAPEENEPVEISLFLRVVGLDELCALGSDTIVEKIQKKVAGMIVRRSLSGGAFNALRDFNGSFSAPTLGQILAAVREVVGQALDLSGVEAEITFLVDTMCAYLDTFGNRLPMEMNGSLEGPTPNVGTLTMPAVGSFDPAIYLCPSDPGSISEVFFSATKVVCGEAQTANGRVQCGGEEVTITMGDNGSLNDDIFEVLVDGVSVLTSSVPVRSISVTLNLTRENHIVDMIGRAAPDGVGTYFIRFDGATVLNGPPQSGSNLNAGVTFTWTVSVP